MVTEREIADKLVQREWVVEVFWNDEFDYASHFATYEEAYREFYDMAMTIADSKITEVRLYEVEKSLVMWNDGSKSLSEPRREFEDARD
jgi:ketosteroid isomerase-like protein